MNIPKLRQQKTIKKCHGFSWEDNYAWIHQENIMEVLKEPKKLNPEVKDIFNFQYQDFSLINYEPYAHINAPVAI